MYVLKQIAPADERTVHAKSCVDTVKHRHANTAKRQRLGQDTISCFLQALKDFLAVWSKRKFSTLGIWIRVTTSSTCRSDCLWVSSKLWWGNIKHYQDDIIRLACCDVKKLMRWDKIRIWVFWWPQADIVFNQPVVKSVKSFDRGRTV